MNKLTLLTLKETFAICKYDQQADIPNWLSKTTCKLMSITRTDEELSIVCDQSIIPQSMEGIMSIVNDWRALKVEGPLDFSLTGILSSLLNPLAEQKISIFALSTYDTDYILIKNKDFASAIEILKKQCSIC